MITKADLRQLGWSAELIAEYVKTRSQDAALFADDGGVDDYEGVFDEVDPFAYDASTVVVEAGHAPLGADSIILRRSSTSAT